MEEIRPFPAIIIADKDDAYSISEFSSLIGEIGLSNIQTFIQKIDNPDKRTYIGKGKVSEIYFYIQDFINNSDYSLDDVVVCCNFQLTGLQKNNLEKLLNVRILDRSFVIFTIFEKNAKTKEAKLQVEIAKLKYLKGQLVDEKASYSQVTSGKGHNKGEGEKKIELNRRVIEEVINFRKNELASIKSSRSNMRSERRNSPITKISIVGYTNVGKSTLMNALINHANKYPNKKVLARNSLFATLETSTRLISSFPYPSFILTDTVGFVSELPTTLVESFRSTLEEVTESDLIIHVVDISNPNYKKQIETTNNILKDIGVNNIPSIYLYNKYDLLYENPSTLLNKNEMYCSLKNDEDVIEILDFISSSIASTWEKKEVLFPYEYDFYTFVSDNYVKRYSQKENGYQCTVYINPKTKYKYNYLFE